LKITGQGPVSWNRVRAAYQQPGSGKGQGRVDKAPAGVDKAAAGANTIQLSTGSKLIRELKARPEDDSVQLSAASRLINDLKTRLAGADDIRSARVEAIRAAVAEGTYKVPVEDVADAILKEMGR
jgi:negative regulator of flagellin synthesis FlgM